MRIIYDLYGVQGVESGQHLALYDMDRNTVQFMTIKEDGGRQKRLPESRNVANFAIRNKEFSIWAWVLPTTLHVSHASLL